MKKIYTLIAAVAVTLTANAQNKSVAVTNANPVANHTIKHKLDRAQGDTLMYFDGEYVSGTGVDGTFDLQNDDIDGLTIFSGIQGSFDATSAFKFFFTTATPTGDTNIFWGATSYFTPVAQADNWLSMGPIAIPAAGGTLKWHHNMQDKNYRDGYKVKISVTGLDNYSDFTDPAVFSVADNDASTIADTARTPYRVFYPRSVDLTAYAGQSIYVAIHHDANDMFIIWFDDVVITEGTATGIQNDFVNGVKINQNMPNPFSNVTRINYELVASSRVVLNVFDVTGKLISSFNQGVQSAGNHIATVNAENLAAGVYYYSFNVDGNTTATKKMVVVK
ncbi:MAG: T9SS type A sorting domain-containing protein [Bacteroidia bacterium]|nr:T9SS type A sorting domain-containing protein [Bacteroidia bacterium]